MVKKELYGQDPIINYEQRRDGDGHYVLYSVPDSIYIITFEPLDDITTYELAISVKALQDLKLVVNRFNDKQTAESHIPDICRMHFYIKKISTDMYIRR